MGWETVQGLRGNRVRLFPAEVWPCGAVSFVVLIESRWVVGDGCVRPQPCLRLVDLRARHACINP